jgi:hypothetical protein
VEVATFVGELVRHFGVGVSTSSQGPVLKCGLNNRKWISSGLDTQKIGKATERKRKRRLPSSGEEE